MNCVRVEETVLRVEATCFKHEVGDRIANHRQGSSPQPSRCGGSGSRGHSNGSFLEKGVGVSCPESEGACPVSVVSECAHLSPCPTAGRWNGRYKIGAWFSDIPYHLPVLPEPHLGLLSHPPPPALCSPTARSPRTARSDEGFMSGQCCLGPCTPVHQGRPSLCDLFLRSVLRCHSHVTPTSRPTLPVGPQSPCVYSGIKCR